MLCSAGVATGCELLFQKSGKSSDRIGPKLAVKRRPPGVQVGVTLGKQTYQKSSFGSRQ